MASLPSYSKLILNYTCYKYKDGSDKKGIKVTPMFGTVVVFLSEEFPHEVLVTQRDRYAIAGWFRLNASILGHIAPPA